MMQYSSDQFKPNEAWLILYLPFQDQDIYFLIDVSSDYIFGNILTSKEIPSESDVLNLMQEAFYTKNKWPKKIFLSWDNPAKENFRKNSKKNEIQIEAEPLTDLDRITGTVKKLISNFT